MKRKPKNDWWRPLQAEPELVQSSQSMCPHSEAEFYLIALPPDQPNTHLCGPYTFAEARHAARHYIDNLYYVKVDTVHKDTLVQSQWVSVYSCPKCGSRKIVASGVQASSWCASCNQIITGEELAASRATGFA